MHIGTLADVQVAQEENRLSHIRIFSHIEVKNFESVFGSNSFTPRQNGVLIMDIGHRTDAVKTRTPISNLKHLTEALSDGCSLHFRGLIGLQLSL